VVLPKNQFPMLLVNVLIKSKSKMILLICIEQLDNHFKHETPDSFHCIFFDFHEI
jgi:hypothetical protein